MEETKDNLEGLPAVFYAAFWQTREMGFLKKILEETKIDMLKILFYFYDYKPGALITLNGKLGYFFVNPVDSLDNVEYDGAVIGKLKPVIDSLEGHILFKSLWNGITRKVKLKSPLKLLKFLRVLKRCAI